MVLVSMLVYFAAIILVGWWAERRNDSQDFLLGGRRTGPLVAAVGAAASSSSAWTLLGVSGASYAWGLSSLWLFPACVGGFAINWIFIAPAARRLGHEHAATSIPDILSRCDVRTAAKRFAPTRIYASILILVCTCAYVAAQYQGAGKTFHAVFGIPPELAVGIGAIAVVLYTAVGGFAAVSITDTIQGLLMGATAIAIPTTALVHVGGWSELTNQLASLDQPGFLSLGGPRTPILAIGFAAGLLGIGLGYPGQPHVTKYFLALDRGAHTIARARTIALLWAALVYGGMLLVGLCGRAMFPELSDREIILVKVTEALVHPVLAGVMLAAVLSAIMSTADSQLLVATGTLVSDFGLGGQNSGERRRAARFVVGALSFIAVAAALLGTEEIFSAVLFGWAAMGAGFGPGLILRAVLGRQLSSRTTFGIMLLGSGLAITAHFACPEGAFRNAAIHVVPSTTALIVGWFVSRPFSSTRPFTRASQPLSLDR